MRIFRIILILPVFAFLASCAFHHYTIHPPPGNTSWEPEEESAIVLIGFMSDEPIMGITVANDIEGIPVASLVYPNNRLNVLAVHFHAGETFQLIGFSYSNVIMNASRGMRFKNLPELEIEKPGIYYYGSFYSKDGKGAFTPKFDNNVIKVARRNFPQVFSALEPVNF